MESSIGELRTAKIGELGPLGLTGQREEVKSKALRKPKRLRGRVRKSRENGARTRAKTGGLKVARRGGRP